MQKITTLTVPVQYLSQLSKAYLPRSNEFGSISLDMIVIVNLTIK